MSYQIRKCPECRKPIHVHSKNRGRYREIRNGCEHIPNGRTTKTEVGRMF